MDLTPQEHEARQNRIPENLLTEALTIKAIAEMFGLNRNKTRSILNHMAGAEQFGGKWRIPVAKCPPVYFQERGLSVFGATECHPMHDQSVSNRLDGEN